MYRGANYSDQRVVISKNSENQYGQTVFSRGDSTGSIPRKQNGTRKGHLCVPRHYHSTDVPYSSATLKIATDSVANESTETTTVRKLSNYIHNKCQLLNDIFNLAYNFNVVNNSSMEILGRPRRRWEDNIKMDLEEVGRGCGDWTELAQDRDRWRALVSTVMNFRVP